MTAHCRTVAGGLKRISVAGAERAYSARGGRFIITSSTRDRAMKRGAWRVVDRATGAEELCWSLTEAAEWIMLWLKPPAPGEKRFRVFRRAADCFRLRSDADCVLLDRRSGRCWIRASENIRRDVEVVEQLAQLTGNDQWKRCEPRPAERGRSSRSL